MRISRRTFCWCMACAVLFPAVAEAIEPQCFLAHGSGQALVVDLRHSSGVNWIDDLVARETRILNDFFAVSPLVLWAETRAVAFMTTTDYSQTTRGAVIMSLDLARSLVRSADEANKVFTILAHEYAHLYQAANGWWDRLGQRPTKRAVELHADYLAGFYLAKRNYRFPQDDPAVVVRAWWEYGDLATDQREHHGTPDQRIAALAAGFDAGKTDYYLRIEDAAQRGSAFVERLI